jgi:predicted nucleic acid-binding protein
LLKSNFTDVAADIVALDASAYQQLLEVASGRGVSGGNIYDVVIVACARAVKAGAILTFNERHFRLLAEPGIDIVAPV